METAELKVDIFHLLDRINDRSILTAIKTLLSKQIKQTEILDFWDELPINVKNDIEEGLIESEEGLITPHSEVMRKIKKKYLNK